MSKILKYAKKQTVKRVLIIITLVAIPAAVFTACEEESALEKPVPATEAVQSPTEEPEQEEVMPVEAPQPVTQLTASPEPTLEPIPEETEPTTPTEEIIVKTAVTVPYTEGYPMDTFGSPYTSGDTLSNEKLGWYFNRNKEHMPPTAQSKFDIRAFNGRYLGDTSQKAVYLTFDEGYENGHTSKILDVLLEKNVAAAFFVTETYINANSDLILRMVNEGHVVGNHSVTHTSFPDLSDEKLVWELTETAKTYKELTSLDMAPFVRPPMGEYSARTLAVTNQAGYKSVFWSFAYRDWLVDEQPGKVSAYQTIMNDLHNGSILLLHAVSQSNTEALPDVIDSFIESGYTFLTLYDLP